VKKKSNHRPCGQGCQEAGHAAAVRGHCDHYDDQNERDLRVVEIIAE
jgi:hypothetical protein